jgi:transcriptional activator HAC1
MPATSKRSRKVAFEDEIDTPTPSDFTGDAESPEPAQKRARKPWGQPVEPFEKIIGPRKRAKTDEEKDQRAKERILRNRKAADASRQRRKDEQDRLQRRIEELEADLEVYQTKFGPLPKHESSISDNYTINEVPQYQPHISPQLLSQPNQPEALQGTSFELTPPDSTDGDMAFEAFEQQPLIKQEQTFTTKLPIDNTPSTSINVQEASYPAESVLTQYPAAILCDPQCQTLSTPAAPSSMAFPTFISLFQLLLISTISTNSCLLTRLSTLIRSTSSLTGSSLRQQLDTFKILTILSSAILLRWISTSFSQTTTTMKPMFRIKLLSRLLSRSPCMARSLETCARKGLQRVVEEGGVGANPEATSEWAGLLTVQWAIRRHVQLSSRERSGHRDCGAIGHDDDNVGQDSGRLGGQGQDAVSVSLGKQVEVSG